MGVAEPVVWKHWPPPLHFMVRATRAEISPSTSWNVLLLIVPTVAHFHGLRER